MQESNLKTLSNSEDPLSISNCKFLTHFSNNSPVLIFGPKLSSSGRKSIDCNYKPSDIDSYDSIIKIPSNDLSKNSHLPIFDNRRSNYSSNGSKKNLRVNTSEVNYSQDQSFINFNENEKKKDEIAEKNEKDNHKKYERYLDNIYFNLFITLITIYALFGSDIQAVFFTLEADVTFDSMTLVSFLIFIIEIILSFAFRKDYRFAFFFWLDIISTCSLLMDVTWVQDALFLE